MSDYEPTPEQVEAAARAILGYRPEDLQFRTDLDYARWEGAKARAIRALTAAGPLIAAEALRGAAPGCDCEADHQFLVDRADRIARGEGS